MPTIYSADDAQKYPLNVPGATFYITHVYGGLDTLTFNISPNHELYPLISEEVTVEYDDILYKVKNINERETACTVSCTIDLDETKANAYKVYRSETRTLRDVLQEQLSGWVLDGVDLVSIRRTIELEKCNGYDVVMQAAKTYNVTYEWHNKEKRVRILKPENVQPSGEYITDELNLRKLTFKGSSKSFATRIYPYGKNGLTIAEVNGGLPYLDNHTYSNQVISTVWADERYTDPISLRDDAIERLKGLAVPARSYECDVVDLAKVHNDYSDLSMKLYDIVTLIDRRRGTRIDHRIAEYKEYPYNPEKNVVTLSSVAEKITTKIDKIEVRFNDEVKVDREKINEIRRDVDTNSARIAETYTRGETDTRIESLVQQSADSITTTVRQEISTAVDKVQIGGRNLLLNSSFADNMDGWFYNGALGNQTAKYGKKCWHITGGVGRDTHVYQKSVLTRVEANTTYTLSGWVLTENIVKGPTNYVAMLYTSGRYNNNGADTWFGYGGKSFTVNTGAGKWEYLSHTFTTDDKIEKATSFFIYVFTRDYTGDIYFYNLKLEKGNKATDWTPAPEDQETSLNQVTMTLEAEINQTAEKIGHRVSEVETQGNDNTNRITKAETEIEQTKSSILQTVKQIIETSNEFADLRQKISQVEVTADGLEIRVGTMKQDNDEWMTEFAQRIQMLSDGIHLGMDGSPLGVQLSNQKLSFLQDGAEVAYIQHNRLWITQARIKNDIVLENEAAGKYARIYVNTAGYVCIQAASAVEE